MTSKVPAKSRGRKRKLLRQDYTEFGDPCSVEKKLGVEDALKASPDNASIKERSRRSEIPSFGGEALPLSQAGKFVPKFKPRLKDHVLLIKRQETNSTQSGEEISHSKKEGTGDCHGNPLHFEESVETVGTAEALQEKELDRNSSDGGADTGGGEMLNGDSEEGKANPVAGDCAQMKGRSIAAGRTLGIRSTVPRSKGNKGVEVNQALHQRESLEDSKSDREDLHMELDCRNPYGNNSVNQIDNTIHRFVKETERPEEKIVEHDEYTEKPLSESGINNSNDNSKAIKEISDVEEIPQIVQDTVTETEEQNMSGRGLEQDYVNSENDDIAINRALIETKPANNVGNELLQRQNMQVSQKSAESDPTTNTQDQNFGNGTPTTRLNISENNSLSGKTEILPNQSSQICTETETVNKSEQSKIPPVAERDTFVYRLLDHNSGNPVPSNNQIQEKTSAFEDCTEITDSQMYHMDEEYLKNHVPTANSWVTGMMSASTSSTSHPVTERPPVPKFAEQLRVRNSEVQQLTDTRRKEGQLILQHLICQLTSVNAQLHRYRKDIERAKKERAEHLRMYSASRQYRC